MMLARAWRWMACMAKWPDFDGWWPEEFGNYNECYRLPVKNSFHARDLFMPEGMHECESALADALERGDL